MAWDLMCKSLGFKKKYTNIAEGAVKWYMNLINC